RQPQPVAALEGDDPLGAIAGGIVIREQRRLRSKTQLMRDIAVRGPLELDGQVISSAQFAVSNGDRVPGHPGLAPHGYGGGCRYFIEKALVFVLFDPEQTGKVREIVHPANIKFADHKRIRYFATKRFPFICAEMYSRR